MSNMLLAVLGVDVVEDILNTLSVVCAADPLFGR